MESKVKNEWTANILIVDDAASNLVILTEIIKKAGYLPRPVTNAKQAMHAMKVSLPQLILLDVAMPGMDGFEFCEVLKREEWTKDIPVIFISGLDSPEERQQGFEMGAVDFITKPFVSAEVISRIHTHLRLFKMQKELEGEKKQFHKRVKERVKQIKEEQLRMIYALAQLSESRDDAIGEHLEHVGMGCKLLAQSLQAYPMFQEEITQEFIEDIELAAPLHDIGKIKIPDRILLKPGKLTYEEMEIMKTHTELGAKSLMDIYSSAGQSELINMAIDIVYYHHEKWDGSGYPLRLKGKDIPLSARIMAVIDVYDTLTSERCYKEAFSHEDSVEIINENAGTSFDPDIVKVFNKIQNQLRRG